MRSEWSIQKAILEPMAQVKPIRKVRIKRKRWFLGLIPYWVTKEVSVH